MFTDTDVDEIFGDSAGSEILEFGTQPIGADDQLNFPVMFKTGAAGTGKTYWAKAEMEKDPKWGILAATTGIAAVNLNAVTLNSLLKYFDTASLQDAFVTGRLQRQLFNLADRKWLVIDEVSMMDGEQLDLLVSALQAANERRGRSGKPTIGLCLTGDFCQLPPVKAKWAFEAAVWPHFERATERLTKVWRQESVELLNGLNYLRQGAGDEGAATLEAAGVQFSNAVDLKYSGTSIFGKNAQVDQFNMIRLRAEKGRDLRFRAAWWGQTMKEWGKLIPAELALKVGALVMILANSPREGFANGDLGMVEEYEDGPQAQGYVRVRLHRTGEVVNVWPILRTNAQASPPGGMRHGDFETYSAPEPGEPRAEPPWGVPYFDEEQGRYVMGAIRYVPLRLGYATTTHKSQGLTLDRVQVDLRDGFMAQPAMCYVALSRARSVEGLRLVGNPGMLAKRCNVDERVRPWL